MAEARRLKAVREYRTLVAKLAEEVERRRVEGVDGKMGCKVVGRWRRGMSGRMAKGRE